MRYFKVCCIAGSADVAACVFAGAGWSGNLGRSPTWLLCTSRPTLIRRRSVRTVLFVLSVCLRSVWVLWSTVVCGRSFHRRRTLVSLGLGAMADMTAAPDTPGRGWGYGRGYGRGGYEHGYVRGGFAGRGRISRRRRSPGGGGFHGEAISTEVADRMGRAPVRSRT